MLTEEQKADSEWRQKMAESQAWVAKYEAETAYLRRQKSFYPIVIASGAALAVTAVVKLFL